MHVHVHAGAHVCTGKGQLPPWYLMGSLTDTELNDKARLGDWGGQDVDDLGEYPPPQCYDYKSTPPHLTIFIWVLGTKLSSP